MTRTLIVQVTEKGQLELPPEVQLNLQPGDEYYLWQEGDTITLKKIEKPSGLSCLWQKMDKLGSDPKQPLMEEITTMVKEVRHRMSADEDFA